MRAYALYIEAGPCVLPKIVEVVVESQTDRSAFVRHGTVGQRIYAICDMLVRDPEKLGHVPGFIGYSLTFEGAERLGSGWVQARIGNCLDRIEAAEAEARFWLGCVDTANLIDQ